jgi:hypothetical protein
MPLVQHLSSLLGLCILLRVYQSISIETSVRVRRFLYLLIYRHIQIANGGVEVPVVLGANKQKTKLSGLSPRANYIDRASAAYRRS